MNWQNRSHFFFIFLYYTEINNFIKGKKNEIEEDFISINFYLVYHIIV